MGWVGLGWVGLRLNNGGNGKVDQMCIFQRICTTAVNTETIFYQLNIFKEKRATLKQISRVLFWNSFNIEHWEPQIEK